MISTTVSPALGIYPTPVSAAVSKYRQPVESLSIEDEIAPGMKHAHYIRGSIG